MPATDAVILSEPSIGDLVFGGLPYCLVSLQVGSPAVRVVSRLRSLANGSFDDTAYWGPRAVTLTLRLDTANCGGNDMQTLIDRVAPYLQPYLRPRLSWTLPGSIERRGLTVRADSWPFTLVSPKFPTWAVQWTAPEGEITSEDLQCITIQPSEDVEDGRTYDLTFDRDYPPTDPIGGRQILNPGSASAHWSLTIFGGATDPSFRINGIDLIFDQVLSVGQSIVVDTREKTILLNGDPLTSVYSNSNYADWAWADLLLHPGANQVVFSGASLGAEAQAQICWKHTWGA